MKLTDKFLRGVQPTEKHQFYADANGLYLRVHTSGTKQFLYRSRVGGKARWLALGVYPEMSLLEARRKALSLAGSVLPESTTMTALAESYRKNVMLKHLKRPEVPWYRIEHNILTVIGPMRVASVTKTDIFRVLQPILDRGANVMANRTLADIKQLMAFARQRGWITTDPSIEITRKAAGGRETPRSKVLADGELHWLVEMLRTHPTLEYRTRLALGLILLTGQRASEVLGIVPAEVSGHWWTIPAARTKPKRETKVYLSRPARAVMRQAVRIYGDPPFTSKHNVLSQALGKLKAGFTPHDLRRTMATRLADAGVMPHVIEKMLNHQMEGVMAVYNRAEYLSERKAAWTQWGRTVLQHRKKGPED